MARELIASRAENEAIRQEMERDATVIMLGEDIAGAAGRAEQGFVDAWGGPMGSTKGLIEQFGPERIIDTPIAEMSFIGAAVGAAMTGLRPIAELMFVNFVGVCLDSIMNEGAFLRYMLGGQVTIPLVIKTSIGAVATGVQNGGGTAAQHSGSMYSIFAHIPGLKCVAPSDDLYGQGSARGGDSRRQPGDLLQPPPGGHDALRRAGGGLYAADWEGADSTAR